MPLPYAPPPKDSKVYRDLKNLKISSVTANQIDTLKAELFAQGVNGSEDEMRRLRLLGEVSNTQSQSGPLMGTVSFKTNDFTADATADILTPAEGEIWRIYYPLAKCTAGSISTTPTYQLWLKDNTTAVAYRIYYFATTSSSPILNEDASWDGEQLVIGHGMTLQAQIGSFSSTNINFGVTAARIR